MYCGDETGAYIGDIGSHTCRFGYGGEDSPKWVVPSYVARYGGDNNNHPINNSTVNNDNNSNQQRTSSSSRYYMPTSCYSPRLAEHQIDSIMRLAAYPEHEPSAAAAATTASKHDGLLDQSSPHLPLPQVDPTAFLQQGDVVQNWDAFEEAWQASFDVLRVRDKYKHTTGGGTTHLLPSDGTASLTTTTATAGGSGGGGEMGVSSTTLRSQPTLDNNDHNNANASIVHPLFCVTPGATHICGTKYNAAVHRDQLVRTTEILMEKLNASATFCAPTPMLGSFSLGRQTALVVDIGAGGCRVTPMVDGLVVKQAQRRNGRGSDYLAHVQWNAMLLAKQQQQQQQQQPACILPRFMLRTKPNQNPLVSSASSRLLYRWGIQDIMYEFRSSHLVSLAPWQYDETLLFQDLTSSSSSLPLSSSSSPNNNAAAAATAAAAAAAAATATITTTTGIESSSNTTTTPPSSDAGDETTGMSSSAASDSIYTLPDGTLVDLTSRIGKDLCRIPELLFTDACPFSSNYPTTAISMTEHDSLSNLPLHKLIHSSLLAVADVDVRKELCHHILLVGGGSLIPQLEQRLSSDVKRVVPSMYQKCRVVASRNHIERSCAAWLGASVLTSLGSFQQLWLSRTEYDEYGVQLSIQRFP